MKPNIAIALLFAATRLGCTGTDTGTTPSVGVGAAGSGGGDAVATTADGGGGDGASTLLTDGDAADASGDGAATIDSAAVDGAVGDAVAAAGKTCVQIGQCAQDDCAGGKQPCGLGCDKDAAPGAVDKAKAVFDCATAKCALGMCLGNTTLQCMEPCGGLLCGPQILACYDDGGFGTKGCSIIPGCYDACEAKPTNRYTCHAACYNQLDAAGKQRAKAWSECTKASTGTPIAALALCTEQWASCVADGKTGQQPCHEVAKCIAKCADKDYLCIGGCYGNGTPAAQASYLAVWKCALNNPTNLAGCLNAFEACAAPGGVGKCSGLVACIDTCKKGLGVADDKGYCTIQCLHDTTPAGSAAGVTLLQCALAKCPACATGAATCTSCLQANCGAAVVACLAL